MFEEQICLKPVNQVTIVIRAANSVDFCIEFEFDIFVFASSSPVKIYQVLSSSENKVIDLAQAGLQ